MEGSELVCKVAQSECFRDSSKHADSNSLVLIELEFPGMSLISDEFITRLFSAIQLG